MESFSHPWHQVLYLSLKKAQVNIFIYSMGPKADNVFQSFWLSGKDAKKCKIVKDMFDDCFKVSHNTIHERAKFNGQQQRETESAYEFNTDLYALAILLKPHVPQ